MPGIRHKSSLRYRLILITVLAVLIPLTIFGAFFLHNALSTYKFSLQSAGGMTIRQLQIQVDRLLASADNVANSVMTNTTLLECLERTYEHYPLQQELEDMRTLRTLLSSYETHNSISHVRFVCEKDTSLISHDRRISINKQLFLDEMRKNGLMNACTPYLQGSTWLLTDSQMSQPDITANSIAYIRMMRNITDYEQVLGYIVVLQDIGLYTSILEEGYPLQDKVLFAIVDAKKTPVAITGNVRDPQALWSAWQADGENALYEGNAVLSIESDPCSNGWRIQMLMPLSAFSSNMQRIGLHILCGILVLVVLTVWCVNSLYYKWIIRRIENLVVAMDRMENEEDMYSPLPIKENDELGKIEQHFNMMLHRLTVLIARNRNMAEQDRLLRIRLLQTQINPHFLYNTLNSIYWVAMDYGAKKVQDMLKALSDFYRCSLQPDQEESTIAHELALTMRYVELMNLRGDKHIYLTSHVEAGIESNLIPNLLLQPIVENSIVHGFINRDIGSISIDIHTHSSLLIIEIADNGAGFSKGTQLLKPAAGQRYGLYSILERLKLRYGEKADLRIASPDEGGSIITIAIPWPPCAKAPR